MSLVGGPGDDWRVAGGGDAGFGVVAMMAASLDGVVRGGGGGSRAPESSAARGEWGRAAATAAAPSMASKSVLRVAEPLAVGWRILDQLLRGVGCCGACGT